MTVTFADISHHQATVDLAAYARAGHDRVILKATGGALDGTLRYVDPRFAERWRAAGQLGLARVAYHFARNNNVGGDEFAWCLSQINAAGGLGPNDVLCYDQEDTRAGMTALARQRTREFVAAAVRAGITTGWVYSGRWYLEPAGIVAADLPAGWRQLWISDYTSGQADNQIEVPAGWSRGQVVVRQFTDVGTVAGVAGTCDLNRALNDWISDMAVTDADTAAIAARLATDKTFLLAVRGQLITALADPTHTYLQDELAPLKAALASILAQLDALATKTTTPAAGTYAVTGAIELHQPTTLPNNGGA